MTDASSRGSSDSPVPGHSLVPFRPRHAAGVVELWHRVFGPRMTVEELLWKTDRRGSRVETSWLLLDGGGRIVFYLGGMLHPIRIGGREREAVTWVDVMTAPDRRRQGLLTAAAASVRDRQRAAGAALLLALPNDRWGTRMPHLGFERRGELIWRGRPLRPFERLTGRTPAGGAESRLDALWNRSWDAWWRRRTSVVAVSPSPSAGELDAVDAARRRRDGLEVARGADWVRWRYADAPQRRHEILVARRDAAPVGWLAWRLRCERPEAGARSGSVARPRRVGVLAEAVAVDDDRAVLTALAKAAIARLRAAGAVSALTLTVPRSASDRVARRAGFVRSWGRFPHWLHRLDDRLTDSDLGAPGVWGLGAGAFDLI